MFKMFHKDKASKEKVDLEAAEMHIRRSMQEVGRRLLGELIEAGGSGYVGPKIECNGFHGYRYVEDREKEVTTVLGKIRLKRAYYYDEECQKGIFPKDQSLGIEGSEYSPGVKRMMARMGAHRAFALGEKDLWELAGISVDAKSIERWSEKLGEAVARFDQSEFGQAQLGKARPLQKVPTMYINADGTGVPVVRGETKGRKGKAEDGIARTREAKLGCVFTQTTVDKEGRPIRDKNSTTYTGAIETAAEFACRIEAEAIRRGVRQADRLCFIADGAAWIWKIAQDRFPQAIQIVDLYHAREHYWKVAREVFAKDSLSMHRWAKKRKQELDAGKPHQVAKAIRQLIPEGSPSTHPYATEAQYFVTHAQRMKYHEFRAQGLFVGSGVLEAGCRSLIGQRLKQSGMHWSVKGANSIIALRACFFSNRWEDFWESQHAA